jgi:hypothetical protein
MYTYNILNDLFPNFMNTPTFMNEIHQALKIAPRTSTCKVYYAQKINAITKTVARSKLTLA